MAVMPSPQQEPLAAGQLVTIVGEPFPQGAIAHHCFARETDIADIYVSSSD